MSDLLKRPEVPWQGFLKGAGWAALMIGVPIICRMLFWPMTWADVGRVSMIGAGLVGAICLAGGLARAGWRLIQLWAYDRISNHPS